MRIVLAMISLSLALPATLAADNPTDRLSLHVSPIVAIAPATVTVQARIDTDADNRALAISVESEEFSRSSQIELDGRNAPRLNVFELRDIPTGLYEVRAVLFGPNGPRATSLKLVRIAPGAGQR
jgi:hypothetical protein